ncbi:hypothetical protein CP061683_1403A, partial [Chlamydia psittaci 06-1683]
MGLLITLYRGVSHNCSYFNLRVNFAN